MPKTKTATPLQTLAGFGVLAGVAYLFFGVGEADERLAHVINAERALSIAYQANIHRVGGRCLTTPLEDVWLAWCGVPRSVSTQGGVHRIEATDRPGDFILFAVNGTAQGHADGPLNLPATRDLQFDRSGAYIEAALASAEIRIAAARD